MRRVGRPADFLPEVRLPRPPRRLLGLRSHPHAEDCDCDPGATRCCCRRCAPRSSAPTRRGPHHGVHEHQPPGTGAGEVRGRAGWRAEPRPCPGREGGAAQTLMGRRGASPAAGLVTSASPSVGLLICLCHWKTNQFGPNWADLSNQEDLRCLYQEERKRIIFAEHFSGQFRVGWSWFLMLINKALPSE